MKRLMASFEHITDTRGSKGKRHKLSHILVMVVCGVLHGYLDFEDIHDYVKANKEWFERRLDLWDGIPCARTMDNIVQLIPPKEFLAVFIDWVNGVLDEKTGQIILDGKALRAATDKAHNGKTPYILNTYLAEAGITLGQVKVGEKSNEITAIPELLSLLSLDGFVITIDAIGTQAKIMDQIKKGGGEFVLPIKANQRGAYAEAVDYFALFADKVREIAASNKLPSYRTTFNEGEGAIDVFIEREKAHGRKTERIYVKTSNVEWLGGAKFKHVQSLVMVICNTTVNDSGIRYYAASSDFPVEQTAKYIRNHWQVENNLHWQLDMYFGEDRSRENSKHGLENLSLIRKLALNIIKLDTRHDRLNKNGNLVRLSTKRKINRYNLYGHEFDELIDDFLPSLVKEK